MSIIFYFPLATTLRFVFLLKNVDFDFDLFDDSSATYESLEANVTNEVRQDWFLEEQKTISARLLYKAHQISSSLTDTSSKSMLKACVRDKGISSTLGGQCILYFVLF